ncbi:MAG: parallel beta-helix domain-containing protein, partial [Pirellulales bacterium]
MIRNHSYLEFLYLAFLASLSLVATQVFGEVASNLQPSVYTVQPGADVQYRLQNILIQAVPGDIIQLEAARYHFLRQIDIATDNITLRGQGPEQTVLSFKGQYSGNQGIKATGDNFIIEGLAVEDTAGNAIKVLGVQNVTFRNVRVEWKGEAKSSNGAYGIYPVQCHNVLIEYCSSYGASDAGIYVGQSRQVVVRHNRAERNVAGIEIENTVGADVYANTATNNTGGILVFDLPGLQLRAGRNVRVFQNKVVTNNLANFAAPGNTVAMVSSGTGIMVMAIDQVEIFENKIADNHTANLSIISYKTTGKKVKDK